MLSIELAVATPALDRAEKQHNCGLSGFRGTPAGRRSRRPRRVATMMEGMKTRTLLLLALVTGLAILAAGAIQILMAK